MHTTMVPEQVKTMKIQAGIQVSRPGELKRQLQLWKRFGRLYSIVFVLVRNISDSSSSFVSGGGVNTSDFPVNNSGNDSDSSDDIINTQNEEVTTLEENIFLRFSLTISLFIMENANPSSSTPNSEFLDPKKKLEIESWLEDSKIADLLVIFDEKKLGSS
ncbi:hypothetical protein Tco_0974418 [Tanacetum coccineum]|uniref:Uncharacterized protein n=1 Tax=Tanacetum coccineum TaxID=301880 RepID=A0ABQ5EBM4_9ASTR